MKRIAVYGATGSVGQQALDVVRRCPGELEVVLMSCHDRLDLLAQAANEFRPPKLAVTSEHADRRRLEQALRYRPEIFWGPGSLVESVAGLGADLALNAVAGIAGLPLLAAALQSHLPTALSNKESIVAGAGVIRRLWKESGTPLYPVDSEHAAIYECLGDSFDASRAALLWLTASGGPFLRSSAEEIARASVAQALAHPNWSMGRKITVDSATMANKGLEVIEAHFLFGVPAERIRVVVQPASLVHSMVAFRDTTVLAQLGAPDMRIPIERALLGERAQAHPMGQPLDFWEIGSLEFLKPDFDRFPCLSLAYQALADGETAVFNAADDAAVGLFLREAIPLGAIAQLIRQALGAFRGSVPGTVPEILELDEAVRDYVRRLVQ